MTVKVHASILFACIHALSLIWYTKKWDDTKLKCDYLHSSLVIMNNQLIAVGGTKNRADKHICQNALMQISTKGNNKWAEMEHP